MDIIFVNINFQLFGIYKFEFINNKKFSIFFYPNSKICFIVVILS